MSQDESEQNSRKQNGQIVGTVGGEKGVRAGAWKPGCFVSVGHKVTSLLYAGDLVVMAWLLIAVGDRFQGCPMKTFPSDIQLSRKESQVCVV